MNRGGEPLDISDTAKFVGVSLPTIYRYVYKRGLKPFRRVGREMFFRRADIEEWLLQMRRDKKQWPLKIQVEKWATKKKRWKKRGVPHDEERIA